MTPRHPPRALGGLTTPTRPPPPTPKPEGPRSPGWTGTARSKPPVCVCVCAAARGVVRRCGPPFLRLRGDASPPSTGGSAVSPRVLREIDIATTTQTLVSRCLRDRRPDCQRRQGGRRQVPPGVAPGPRPFPAPSWPLTRGRGSRTGCPAPHPAGAETATDIRPESPPAPAVPGRATSGARRRSLVRREAEWKRSACEAGEPRWGAGGGPPGGRDGADVDLVPGA